MLNYSKILSDLTSASKDKKELILHLGLSSSTYYDRLSKRNFTPNDIEGIAAYFNRSLLYYFDKEPTDIIPTANEIEGKYNITRIDCEQCISKKNEIDALKQALAAKDELLELYRHRNTGNQG
jgi:hypothetical protein